MKKLLVFVATAGAVVLGSASASFGVAVTTPAGTAGVADGNYIVVADGNSGNPDPLDGYVGVGSDGISCAAEGGPYNDDGSVASPAPAGGCSPSVP